MIDLLANLTPDAAVLLLTLGLTLIAVELNRPGSILPGALGLLLSLLAAAILLHHHPRLAALALLIASSAALLLQLRLRLPLWAVALSTLVLIAGLLRLFPAAGRPRVHPAAAIPCCLFLAAGTTMLTRLAHRARQNKGLD
jgi:membrane-bound serine protease (ClpP class)